MTIEEAYISFEIAKLLKEKGFDEGCRYYYVNNGNLMFTEEYLHNSEIKYGTYPSCVCTAPTQQMAMRWLREIHNIFIVIEPRTYDYINEKISSYVSSLWQRDNYCENITSKNYPTYEEAVEATIQYCLKNLI